MKCVKLILKKIMIIVATRSHILQLKCTKLISAEALPQTTLGSLQHSPRSPSWI